MVTCWEQKGNTVLLCITLKLSSGVIEELYCLGNEDKKRDEKETPLDNLSGI